MPHLFVLHLGSREVHLLGVSEHPNGDFVTQVARNLVGDLVEQGRAMKFLIRDRDTKFTANFHEVFASEGIRMFVQDQETESASWCPSGIGSAHARLTVVA